MKHCEVTLDEGVRAERRVILAAILGRCPYKVSALAYCAIRVYFNSTRYRYFENRLA